MCDQHHAHVRPVEVGAREADRVEIARGLGVGDRVVIDAVLALDDGAALDDR